MKSRNRIRDTGYGIRDAGYFTLQKETQVYARIVDEELDNAMDVFNEKRVVKKKRDC